MVEPTPEPNNSSQAASDGKISGAESQDTIKQKNAAAINVEARAEDSDEHSQTQRQIL